MTDRAETQPEPSESHATTRRVESRVQGEVRSLVDQAFGDDPRLALAAFPLLDETYLPWVEQSLVWRARAVGKSWAAIGRLLGRSRQAVQQRFDRTCRLDELMPPQLPQCEGALLDAEYEMLLSNAAARARREELLVWDDAVAR